MLSEVSNKQMVSDYYRTHYVATVRIDENGIASEVVGKNLKQARKDTHVCYAKDYDSGEEVLLFLKGKVWVKADSEKQSAKNESSAIEQDFQSEKLAQA